MSAVVGEIDSGAPDMGRVNRRLRDTLSNLDGVTETVQGMAFFSRWPDVLAPVPLERVVQAAVALARTEVERRAVLVVDVPPDLWVVTVETRLGQVLLDLLLHTARSIPHGGAGLHTVSVAATGTDDGHVALVVQDDGSVLGPKVLERIQAPLLSGPRAEGGVALGLARESVVAMGGSLDVQSVPFSGTTTRVLLPAGSSPTQRAHAEAGQTS